MDYIHPDMALLLAATFVLIVFIRLYRQTEISVRGFGWIFSGISMFLLASFFNYFEETPLGYLMLEITDEEGWDFIVPVFGYAPGGLMFCFGFAEWLRMAFVLKKEVEQREIIEQELEAALAEAGQANVAKDQFLATMSHELRTPLTAIIGFSEIMSDPKYRNLSKAEYSDYSGIILQSGKHLLKTIDDILSLAQVQAKEYKLSEGVFDLNNVLNECVYLLLVEAEKANVMVKKPPESGIHMYGDRRLVKQIILNLISNGIKFIKDGGEIVCSLDVNPDCGIILTVSDNGIGMAPDEAKQALEPFTQIAKPQSRHKMGSGLGLTLVKRFVEMHEGTVEITSQKGKGTDVRVVFPIARLNS